MTEGVPPKPDTTNRHLVTEHQGKVVMQFVPRALTAVQAVELAAWLVAMAECAELDPKFDAEAYFGVALAAIRNT
jgi:hypothetical protein